MKKVFVLLSILIILGLQETSFAEITPVADRTTQVRDAIVAATGANSAGDVTDAQLSAITNLNLRSKGITELKSGDFSGLTGLTNLSLFNNELSSLPDGIFEGLTALTTLRLGGNTVDPMQITISLEKVGENQFKAVVPTGAPFSISVPISTTNGSISGNMTSLTISIGAVESTAVTVTRTAETTATVTANIGTLSSLPARNHYGYTLSKSGSLPIEVIGMVSITDITDTTDMTDTMDSTDTVTNTAPVFADGTLTTRTIVENAEAGVNIGNAVSATDADNDSLTYTLSGINAESFSIDSDTGQLKTKSVLDYETKRIYILSVNASDKTLTSTISVIISVIDRDDTPAVSTMLSVSDRTTQVRDAIIAAVPVTDAANVTEAHLAAITSLNLRNVGISELKTGDFSGLTGLTSLNLYGNMLRNLSVRIFEGLTSLTSLRLGGNIIAPMPLMVSLQQVSDNQFRAIIPTGAPFDIVLPINGASINTVTISKGSVTSESFAATTADVQLGNLPNLPVNHFGYILAKSTVCNRTIQVSDALVSALQGIDDCRNISEADLATVTALDLSNASIISLQSDDFSGLFSLETLNLANNQLENLPDSVFVGLSSLTSLDLSGNTVDPLSLNMTIQKVGENGIRIIIPTGAPYNITLPITVANGSLNDNATSITIPIGSIASQSFTVTRTPNTYDAVTVSIGNLPSLPTGHTGYALILSDQTPFEIFKALNVAPEFTEGESTTRSIAERTVAGVNIGSPISATDDDDDSLTYTVSGTDATSFDIDPTTGQLKTKAPLDYETKTSYMVTVSVSDETLSNTINVIINVTDIDDNRRPEFTEGDSATRIVAENTSAGVDIGSPVSATDPDDDTLAYSLGGTDATSFSIDSTSGQIRTNASLDYETKSSYSVTVDVSDDEFSDSIAVTINIADIDETTTDVEDATPNNAPVFTEGSTTTRTVAENTGSGVNIGDPVSATDEDKDTLDYSLGGTDASSFSIGSADGRLRTSAALDYETKSSYSVTITVSDGNDGSDTISVTINITDIVEKTNTAPEFTDGNTTSRSVAENTGSGVDIDSAVSATDADDDTLNYSLGGTDDASFSVDSSSGQLRTSASLDYETKSLYTVTMTVSDGNGGSDSITITINITDVDETTNTAPVFTDGSSTSRSVNENTGSGVDIGSAVSATDADNDTLTYSLGGTDVSSFSIDSSSGQLRTSASLDYETKSSYSVTITVSDGNGGSASITVTIDVNDIDESPANNAPVFTDGSSTTRTIAENTATNVNIGSAVSATDADDDTLSYSLSGTDATSFSINSTNGQLKTNATLNFETKTSYTVMVSASDGQGGSSSINVTIYITNVNEAPVFTAGTSTTRSIAENAGPNINIGSVVSATDVDSTTLTYTLGGTNGASFDIESTTGQLKTKAALDYETKTSYSVTITVSDGSLTDSIAVTINVRDLDETPSNIAPVFTDGDDTTRRIAENTVTDTNIGNAIAATDEDSENLAYLLSGTDASSFAIDGDTGQLKTSAALNYETKTSYEVIVTVSDGTLEDEITVTINVTNVNEAPVFTDGESITRQVAENTVAGTNLGNVITATDPDADDTITYSLSGADAASFDIGSTSGQLQTKAALDYETKMSYTVTVTATDSGNATDTITVTINVTDVNENRAPAFASESTTRSIAENTGSGVNIGDAVSATDPDTDDTLEYSLGGTDAASFDIGSTNGQLRTKDALDYETKASYSVTVSVSDGNGGTDSIAVTINITDVNENRAPVFSSESTTRSIAENTGSGVNIGDAVSATDPDTDDTLEYSLSGTDAASFDIGSTNGQLRTKAALDYETKASYSVTVSVSDGNGGTDSIAVTINVTDVPENRVPAFSTDSASRSVAENTGSGVNIGIAITATDPDSSDTLEYSLGGTDASSFSIDSTSGQLRTNAALNYETKNSYSVTVSVSDGNGGTDSIAVTINITDVNEAPTFTENSPTTRSIAENTASDTNIGSAVSATDPDSGASLTYGLGGTDAASFSIDSSSGQLKTKTALDYEDDDAYEVTVIVSDDDNLSASITVNISITDVNENTAPSFSDSSFSYRISDIENASVGDSIGDPVTASDTDDDTLSYSVGGDDAALFDIDSSSGQLKITQSLIDHSSSAYSIKVIATDPDNATAEISGTIFVTRVTRQLANNPPIFDDGESITLSVAENTASGENIGDPVAATDDDTDDTLTYTLEGTDAASFSIVSTSGQLQTSAALDYETKNSYSVTVKVTDDSGASNNSDTIAVTINVTDGDDGITPELNNAPVFADESTTLSVAENTASGENIGSPITATDDDAADTLTYSLEGTDAASFAIVSTSGQLQTSAALDYATKNSYSITVKVTDDSGASNNSDTITVTINVTIETLLSNRTAGVRNAILNAIEGVDDAADVTETHLAAITGTLGLAGDESIRANGLKSGDFEGLTSLTGLSLGQNELTILPDGIFDNLTSLTTLDLTGNELTSLPDDIFDNLTSLTTLKLISNDITTLPDGIFDNLTSLTLLDFFLNELTTLPDGIFDNLTSLTHLNLDFTEIASISATIFDNLTSLTILEFEAGNLTSLPAGVFDNLTALTRLDLDGHEISILPDGIFKNLTNLEILELDSNELSTIPAGTFAGLTNIKELYLYGNAVEPLPINIDFVAVPGGKIKAVAPIGAPFELELPINVTNGIISGGATGVTIAVGATESETITVTRAGSAVNDVVVAFGNMPSLPSGHMGYSLIKGDSLTISTGVNTNITPVSDRTAAVRDAIVAKVSGVTDAADVTVTHLAAITGTLDLSSNTNLQSTGIKSGDFHGLTSLTGLNLSGNNLNTPPTGIFSDLTSLTHLNLSSNNIQTLGNNFIDNLTSLKILELESASLTSLPTGIFDNLTALTKLDLDSNNISSLPDGIFKNLTNLEILELDGNDLSAVPTGTFVGLTNITELKLGGNTVDPLSINLTLEFVSIGKIKVVAPIGLPFEFDFPITVTNGSISGGGTGVTIAAGATNSETITIIRTMGTTTTVTAAFGDLPDLPSDHEGYSFTKENSLTVFRDVDTSITPVSERTASVRDAIVAKVSGVDDAAAVTSDHLLAITGTIDLSGSEDIRTNGLKSGDFDGLTSLTGLDLIGNKLTTLPDGIFDNLTSLTTLNLAHNGLTTLPDGIFDNLTNLTYLGLIWHELGTISDAVFDNLTSLKTLDLKSGPLTSLPEGVFDNLTALTTLDLYGNKISTLPDEIFKNLTNLEELELGSNELSAIPAGTFVGLTSLTNLYLDENKVDPLPLNISLQKVSSGEFKVVIAAGAPFSLDLPVYVQDGSISGDVTSITIPKGSTDSSTFTVTRNEGSAGSVVVVNSGLPSLPSVHDGYSLIRPSPIIVIDGNNAAPYFPDGLSTTRFVNENADYDGEDFDEPVTAIDIDGDSMTYSLGGTDASKFSIDSTTGQLQTNEVFLSYNTLGWSRYNVTVIATDDSGTDNDSTSINVRIQVTEDKGSPPLSSLTSQNYLLQIPDSTAFLPNYPNPFNPETWIPYQLSKAADVSLTIYDMRGVVIRKLDLGHKPAGYYTDRTRAAYWDGRNVLGEKVAAGVYFSTFKAGDFTATRKMLILK